MARTPSKSQPRPYRGDDPSVGKKTGMKIARVERTSDGFEPFNDLLSQANTRTPPRRKKKKSVPRANEDEDEEEDDEDGEESMEIDSPVQYATTPRASTSARPISRGAGADFDAVPSPRPRKSVGQAGSSRLARTLTARELLEQDEDEEDGGMDNQYQDDDFGGYENEDTQDDDDEERAESPPQSKVSSKPQSKASSKASPTRKSNGRTLPPVEEEDEEDMEDDIARGMLDVERDASDEEEDAEEVESAPPKKKARPSPVKRAKPKPSKPLPQKENRDVPAGVRRSKRVPYPPLEFWRGEKVVFGPREQGQPRQVPHITEIVRIPREDPPPRRAASKRKRAPPRSRSKVIEREVVVEVPVDAGNPEAGWDDDTDPLAAVLDYRNGQAVNRRVAFTSKMFKPVTANPNAPDNDKWLFEKIFGDGDFLAAGQLIIPVNGRKPSKATKDNTYIFLVVEGAVNVHVHETSFVLASGGMFMVPRGNTYFIENIAERESKLFFTQARKMDKDEDDGSPPPSRGVSVARGGASVRSGSAR
ncbi:Mif2/CENP-C like-domain-containing protein [Mycena crocata]|nr:Mif2/CENP-C like-domain-containing protein [Mycena crocata]